MPVAISRDADVDVDGILVYSIAAPGRAIAEAYFRNIYAAFDRISDFPELSVGRLGLWSRFTSQQSQVMQRVRAARIHQS